MISVRSLGMSHIRGNFAGLGGNLRSEAWEQSYRTHPQHHFVGYRLGNTCWHRTALQWSEFLDHIAIAFSPSTETLRRTDSFPQSNASLWLLSLRMRDWCKCRFPIPPRRITDLTSLKISIPKRANIRSYQTAWTTQHFFIAWGSSSPGELPLVPLQVINTSIQS